MDATEHLKSSSAKDIIKDIRIEHGVEESFLRKIANDADLQRAWKFKEMQLRNALKELSAGLYTKDTHFILELIQNADDNKYAKEVEPCLHFTSKSRRIRIDCNELGFEEKHVRAICSIGESTKKRSESTGYIGEKGIGFKSVFKAADVVHIRSGDYSFKFDTSDRAGMQELGMLAPVWGEFPSDELVHNNHTQILMDLSAKCNVHSLHEELKELKPTLLLFLRKLNLIKIDISNETCKIFSRKYRASSSNVLITETINSMGSRIVTMSHEYVVIRHVVTGLPKDPKRVGVSTAEIVLAFPLGDGEPYVTGQLVYAFLPLRDYGFKFLIQADFLVPSNRGDIQECDWNYVLRDEVIRAFQLAVFKFITMPRLQYTWLRFLPDGWHSNSFMSTLANAESSITKDLKYRKILWSRAQTLEAPVTLTYVSARFLDRDLNPLMGDHGDYQYQLSPSYAQGDLHALYRLGVREMTPGTFLEKLAKADGRNIRDCRSSSYHVDLAKCLKGIGLSYWSDISRLKLIPLRTGEWVTGSSITSSPIYFEDGEGDFCVPSAIDIRIADPSATQNRARKELFEWLGVKYCSKQEVCTLILKEHRGEFQGFKTLDNLRSHAVYLYKFGKTPMNSRFDHIWLVDASKPNPCLKRGRDLYIDIPGSKFAVSSVLNTGYNGVAFIHPSYIKAGGRDWIDWLIRVLSVSDIPRIKEREESKLSLTFTSIIKSSPSKVFLKILTDYWSRYSMDITESIEKEISSARVDCSSGQRTLKETIAPLPSLIKRSKDLGGIQLPFLTLEASVDDPTSLECLQRFGVTITEDANFYMLILQSLRTQDQCTMDVVYSIYMLIGARLRVTRDSAQVVYSTFDTVPLVFRPTFDKKHEWIHLKECVWTAPACLQSKFSLSPHYSDCEYLFRNKLEVKDATMAMIVDDLITFADKGITNKNVQVIKSMLLALVRYVEKEPQSCILGELGKLQNRAFLPIREPGGSRATLMYSDSRFFIPDRQALCDRFKDSLPLMDFTIDQIHHIRPLIDNLGISQKSLLSAVTETWTPIGSRLEDLESTEKLRSKSQALFRCARHFGSKKAQTGDDTLLQQLRTLQIVRVNHIQILQKISSQGFTVVKETTGEVYFKAATDGLTIYFPLDEENMTAAWAYYLPTELEKFLGISNSKAKLIISSILQLSGAPLQKILDSEEIGGIEPVDPYSSLTETSVSAKARGGLFGTSNNILPKTRFGGSGVGGFSQSPTTSKSQGLFGLSGISQPNTGFGGFGQASNHQTQAASMGFGTSRPIDAHQHSVFSGTSGLFQTASTSQGPATSRSQSSSSTFVEPIELEGLRSNPWAKPTSVELQSAFPDIRDRMQAIATSAEDFELDESAFMSNKSATRGSRDALDMSSLKSSLPTVDISQGENSKRRPSTSRRAGGVLEVVTAGSARNRTDTQRRIDFGIGFMGEFFVIELLRKVLPDFDPDRDWTSGLRGWARLYEDYKGLSEYTKREVSDITYDDGYDGSMTEWFVSKGCERARSWLAAPPTYHVEVKTTTVDCEERFYVSNNQVKLAEEMTVTETLPEKVYVIFRVFHVNQSPNLHIYLDPWALFQEGDLVLTAEGYSVKPGQSL